MDDAKFSGAGIHTRPFAYLPHRRIGYVSRSSASALPGMCLWEGIMAQPVPEEPEVEVADGLCVGAGGQRLEGQV